MNRLQGNLDLLTRVRQMSAERRYSEVEQLIGRLPPERILADLELGFCEVVALMYLRKTEEGLASTDRLLRRAHQEHDVYWTRRVELIRSAFLSRAGRLDEAEASIEASMTGLSWSDATPYVAEVINSSGIIRTMRGMWDSAISQLQRALAVYQQLGHLLGVARVYHNLGVANRYAGHAGAAEAYFVRATRLFDNYGTPEEKIFSAAERALALMELGESKLALSTSLNSVNRSRDLGTSELMGETLRVRGTVLRMANQREAALTALENALGLSHPTSMLRAEVLEEMAIWWSDKAQWEYASERAFAAIAIYESIGAQGYVDRLFTRFTEEQGHHLGFATSAIC